MTTPFENLFHIKPDLTHLRVWGCDAYAHIDEQHRESKLTERSVHGIFIGFDTDNIARIFVPATKKIIHRGDVHFIENVDHLGKVVLTHAETASFNLEASCELLRLPDDFHDSEDLSGFTFSGNAILSHVTVFHEGETQGLLRVKLPERPGGVWVWLRAFLSSDSHTMNYTILKDFVPD